MRYDEPVTLSYRESTDDDFVTVDVFADVQDEGTASFDLGSGLTRADAFSVTMRYFSMPEAMRTLLYNVTQRATLGDFTLARCRVRGRDLLITSISTADERQRETTITCTSRQV